MAEASTDSAHVQTETRAFTAEVSRLLEILVHSVYADRDVFLRELISNAADACDRLRYEAVTRPGLVPEDSEFRITVIADSQAGTLTVEDNGIGMGREELTENLGTIARSGSRAFMMASGEAAAGEKPSAGLIGQFGVGFYSAFMVASEVSVVSVRAGSDEAWQWVSDGTGAFTVAPAADRSAAPARGTAIVLKLRDDDKSLADAGRLAAIVKAHSDHVQFPIDIVEVTDGARGEPVRANAGAALWARPRSEVTPEQYKDFYGSLGGLFDEPALTLHYRAEGRHEYTVLLFVPASRPFDIYEPSRKSAVRLYVRRVLIDPEAALLPSYLRFVRGVVDSEDMPLTISRDMMQQNPVAAAIRKAVTNRVLTTLKKEAEDNPDKFATIWEAFGPVIKEGLYEDYERRDELLELLRFRSTAGAGLRTLKDYVADLKPNQTAIYYITGEDPARIAESPQLEGFRARGLEVMLLTDPVDSFWTQGVSGYEGKPLRSATQGGADLSNIALEAAGQTGQAGQTAGDDDEADAGKDKPGGLRQAELATVLAFLKEVLGEAVSDVRFSERLVESPACLVAPEGGLDRGIGRILRERGQGPETAPVLEVNSEHPVLSALGRRLRDGGREASAEAARTLLDFATIADGEVPRDPKAFARRLTALIEANLR